MSTCRPRFEVHKAQKIAAALLLIFLLQSLWLLAHLPLDMAESRDALAGKSLWTFGKLSNSRSSLIPGDSILALRCAGLLPSVLTSSEIRGREFSIYAAPSRWLVRLPFLVFGVWLGAALWWVARRIFGDEGAYIALALYCLSPAMLLASATVDSAILAAWGLFGLVFTAIGVAHTLYAPWKKWRPRVLLLGLAIGLTAAASVSAALAGLLLAGAFMLYLAPGRRLASVAILGSSSIIGALVFFACFGFSARDIAAAGVIPDLTRLKMAPHFRHILLSIPGGLLEIIAFLSCLLVFIAWRRTHYFGNFAPLVVTVLLLWWPTDSFAGSATVWVLPFAFVFVGGIYADLLEPQFLRGRFRKHVVAAAIVLIGASTVLSFVLMAGA